MLLSGHLRALRSRGCAAKEMVVRRKRDPGNKPEAAAKRGPFLLSSLCLDPEDMQPLTSTGLQMKIAIITTYRHPTRLPLKERSVMQSSVPELIASLCPAHAEIELYNEKEVDIPLEKHWDLVFFSYLHSFYEHTKVLSALFKARGMVTVAGGRHASYYTDYCSTTLMPWWWVSPRATLPCSSKILKRTG